MDIEVRLTLLDHAAALLATIRRDLATEDLGGGAPAQKEEPPYVPLRDREIVANLRAQVADLTRERDAWKATADLGSQHAADTARQICSERDQARGALSVCEIDLRAAIARAEKAETQRDHWRREKDSIASERDAAREERDAATKRAEKAEREFRRLEDQRCDHCGYIALYSGSLGCSECGAPECCRFCCMTERLRRELNEARERAEKAERERVALAARDEALLTWRSDVADAVAGPYTMLYDDVPKLIREIVSERDDLRAQLTARDATIAEDRYLLLNCTPAPWLPAGAQENLAKRLKARLTGQPAPKTDEQWRRDTRAEIALLNEYVREVGKERDAARAEVARLEGLRKRCEAWLDWFLYKRGSTPPEMAVRILADLRAGRAAT